MFGNALENVTYCAKDNKWNIYTHTFCREREREKQRDDDDDDDDLIPSLHSLPYRIISYHIISYTYTYIHVCVCVCVCEREGIMYVPSSHRCVCACLPYIHIYIHCIYYHTYKHIHIHGRDKIDSHDSLFLLCKHTYTHGHTCKQIPAYLSYIHTCKYV